MSQTTYNTVHPVGLEGASVDETLRRVTSFLAEGAVTPGYAVTVGTDADTQRKLVVDGNSSFNGVALEQCTLVIDDSTNLASYKDKEGMSVQEKGRIWVHVDAAVAVDDPAYVLATGVDKGRFTKTSTGNIATGGKFVKSTAGAGLTILEL